MDFAIPEDYGIKIKESKKLDKDQDEKVTNTLSLDPVTKEQSSMFLQKTSKFILDVTSTFLTYLSNRKLWDSFC